MPSVRFQKGGAYTADISNLRSAIRANAVNVNCVQVPITHPSAAGQTPSLYINMAYQANSALQPATASLYTVGFSNTAGAGFKFNIVGPGGLSPFTGTTCAYAAFTQLTADGSYGSLGNANPPFPSITDANLATAVAAIGGYTGGALSQPVQVALVRLLIAVSEAVRFDTVASGVAGVLGNTQSYDPDWTTIHNWGGHTLGS